MSLDSAPMDAVAVARLGPHTATITDVGDDPFGRFVRRAIRDSKVSDRFVVTNTDYPSDPNEGLADSHARSFGGACR